MKKIFTLIAVAALAVNVQAQGIAWAFNVSSDTAPVISDANITEGSVTVTGTASESVQKPSAGENAGIEFVTFAPADGTVPFEVTWSFKVSAPVSPKNVSLRLARFGTDAGLVDLTYVVDGGDPVELATDLIPARNNKTKADDAKGEEEKYTDLYSSRLRGVTINSSFTLTATYKNLATNKSGGFAEIKIQTGDEAPTAIKSVKAAVENGTIYNLAGQKVSDSYKGVVIQNGKKLVK